MSNHISIIAILVIFTFGMQSLPISVQTGNQAVTSTAEKPRFEAIQEQLGLKLTPAKVPTQFLVVDDVQMPSIN